MESLGVEKVYLMYLDEVKHVHWHLVPRYEERGFNILLHSPAETKDFSLAKDIKLAMEGSKI
jgi:diadenosine tetraphosphate (Ap4A) HIT family hydrolase